MSTRAGMWRAGLVSSIFALFCAWSLVTSSAYADEPSPLRGGGASESFAGHATHEAFRLGEMSELDRFVRPVDEAAHLLRERLDRRAALADPFGFDEIGEHTPSGEYEAPARDRMFPFLPGEASDRSYSIGTVTTGWVVGARALEIPGRTWDMLPRQRARGLVYGTDEVIGMLMDAADEVAAHYPDSTLWMGNIGRQGGGDIPYSVSHNAGRDADIGFYTLDPDGNVVQPPGLLRFDDRGHSRDFNGYYRFDVERNWLLVRSLLTSDRAQVQFLFISNGLRRILLQHARAIGEPSSLIERAGRVMSQPGPEIPHDDHLHLRVYCTEADKRAGCVNIGRIHPGTERHRSARSEAISDARTSLRHEDAAVRAAAIERLVVMDANGAVASVRGRLSDPSPWVRSAAARALGELGSDDDVLAMIARMEHEDSADVEEAILRALGALGGRAASTYLRTSLRRDGRARVAGKVFDLRLVALSSLVELGDVDALAAIVPLLSSPDAHVRDRADWSLRHLTNHDPAAAYRNPRGADPEILAELWQLWMREHVDMRRPELLRRGFAESGYDVTVGRRGAVAATLARAAGADVEHVRVNAQRELMRITGNTPRSLEWSAQDAQRYWTRWVRRNPGRIQAAFR